MVEKIADEVINIHLTIPKKMYELLEKEKRNFSYLNTQTIILEAVRKRYYYKTPSGKKGKPRKVNLNRVASRKNVFKKGGEGKIL